MDGKRPRAGWMLFLGYLLVMAYLLFLMRYVRTGGVWGLHPETPGDYWEQVRRSVNLVPLRTIRSYLHHMDSYSMGDIAFRNVAGNVLLFIPFGSFMPHFFRSQRRFGRFFLTALILLVCVECAQVLMLLGSCDIDDVLLNLLGNVTGFLLWAMGHGIAALFSRKRGAAA